MKRSGILIILLLCWVSTSIAAPLITEPNDGREPFIKSIESAKHSVRLVLYTLTDPILIHSLIEARKKGIAIEIILEASPYRNASINTAAQNILNKNHIAVKHGDPSVQYTHQKTLVIDNTLAYIMTGNFTRSSFESQRNFAIQIDNPKQIDIILKQFDRDWREQANKPHDKEVFTWSPGNTTAKIKALIDQGNGPLNIYAPYLQISSLIKRLSETAPYRSINILSSASAARRNKHKLCYLARHHVHIRILRRLFPHAKIVISHDKNTINYFLGSQNFSQTSMQKNRELGLIESNKFIGKELNDVFQSDWNNAAPLKC